MRKTYKRFLSLLVCAAMVLTSLLSLQFPALAAEGTRYVEVDAFSGDGNYILAVEGSDGLVALSSSSSGGYSEAVSVTEASGEDAAYIETSSTNVVWSYTASDGYLKNGSNYLYPGSGGMRTYRNGREIIFEDGKLHVTTSDGSTYYITYGADGFGTSTDVSAAATFRLFKEGDEEPVEPPTPEDPTRYEEVGAFSGDGEYILAVEVSDGAAALANDSSAGYAEAMTITEAAGEEAAYIETSSTKAVWSYTASNGYLKNGSNYLYPGSRGMQTSTSSGREIIFEDGKLHVSASGGTTYVTYGANGFGTSTDASAAATFRLFKEGGGEPVDPPTPEDPTRYEEVGAFSGDGEYILAVETGDGVAALANDSSAGYAETMTITEAAGEEAAYIETDSTKAVWSYTADNGYLQNGSDYVYAGSAGMQTYTSGREIIFEAGKIHVTTRDGSTYYMTYGSDGFGTSKDASEAATFRLFKEGGGEPVEPPTPEDPTRYEEVGAFSGDGEYILAVEVSDGAAALANDSSAGYAEAMTITEAAGEDAAYIETSSTKAVWSYTASNGYLKNGSDYVYAGSRGMATYTSGREIIFEDGKIHVTTRDGSTYYMTYGSDGFGTSNDAGAAATFRLFKEGGGEPVDPPTPVDPTRYEEVGSLSGDGDYILAATNSDTSVNAIAKSGSGVSAQSLTVVPAAGDTAAYIETDSTSVVWSYTESDKYLKNGSSYLYPRSDSNISAYSSGRAMSYADGHLYFESSSSGTYYLTYGSSGFATSSDVGAAATFRLFKLGGGEDPVDPPLPTGDAVYVAFTSDVHNGASSSVSSADRLKDWTNIVTGSIGSPFDTFGFCGDLGPASGNTFWTNAQGVMDAVTSLVSQGKIANDGFYVCGNHEYNPGNYTHNSNSTTQRYTDAGGSYDGGDYLLFSMGARQWNEEYSDSDINQMKDFLAANASFKKPIFILSHYPLHCYGNYSSGESTSVHDGRAAVGSAKIAAALNEATETYGQTIVYLWGHNHSSNNYYYDEILHSINGIGDVSFTYCAAGCMSDREYGQSGNVKGKGLVVGIYNNYMTMTYYNIDGDPLADPVVIEFQGGEPLVKHTITASAGANGSISPSGEVSVVDGRDKEFTFIPDSGYKVGTVMVDGNDVTASVVNNKYTMENVTADHTIEVTFEELPVSFYVLTDNFTDGQEYLIVNANSGNGYALRNPGGETEGADLAATAVTIDTTADVDGDGQSDISIAAADADIVWTASASAGRTGAFDLRNNGDYLEGKGGNMNIFKTQQYPARAWEYANSKLQFLGGDYSYVLYYSNNNFTGSNYNASSGSIPSQAGNIYLFEKVESGDLVKYTVTASAGANGKISPSGEVSVIQGRSKTFTFTPDPGYEIDKVLVGGTDVTAQVADNQYTISNVTSDTTIEVTFKKAEVTAYKLAETVNTSRKYLVVSNGYALRNNNGEIAATRITEGEDGLIYINNSDDTAAVKWSLVNAVPVGDNLQSGDYTVENGSYKFYRYSDASGNPTPARLTTENPISENSGYPYYQWSYDAENQQLKQVGGQDGSATFYAYYNTSENAFYTAAGEQNLGLYIPYEDVDPEWGEPTYEWAEDNSTVTAVRVSGSDPSVTETETVEATSKITKDATCEEKGEITYTSAEFKNTAFTVQTKTEEIDPLGHDLQHHEAKAATCKEEGNIEYWTCERCGKFFRDADGKTEITEADTVLAKTEHSWNEGTITKNATCTEAGQKVYTCSICGETKTEEIPALGHKWTFKSFEWIQNGETYSAIVYYECENDPSHQESVTPEVTVEIERPTCTENGRILITAFISKEAALDGTSMRQIKEETILPLGHKYGEPAYEWAEDDSTVTAKMVCENDASHVETETVDTTVVVTEATCEEAGSKVYTAEFENDAFQTQTKTIEIPATGHDWKFESFNWSKTEDGYTGTASYICRNDAEHKTTADADVTSEKTEATCTEEGSLIYTAVISEEKAPDGAYREYSKEITLTPLGHAYGEPEWTWDGLEAATAVFTCANDATHTETLEAEITTAQGTGEDEGYTVYTAAVVFENKTYTDQKKVINQYTLTFKDGDEVLGVITQDYGTEITAPEDPEKEGFVFQGWDPEVPATMPAQDMTITAKWIVLSYELDKTSIEKLPVGSTEQLTLVGSDGSTGKGTWTSSDENVAKVDENGLVTAVKYGKAVIHVVMENGYEADCTVQTRFWDVAGSPNKDDPDYQYYFNAVYWAADHDPLITRGYDLEYFGVGMPCNRQEFILFIYRLANSPSVDTSKLDATFSDVGSLSNTFRKAIAWGSNKGIIKGYTSGENAGKFGKDFPITRKDAMIMLYRYAGKPAPSKAGLDAVKTFTDVQGKFGTTTDTYKAIAWAAGKGITNGYKNQSDIPAEFNYKVPCFGCDMPCMREQMIVFLYRFATQ